MNKEIDNFIAALTAYEGAQVYNPWRDYDERYDAHPQAPAVRRKQLAAYLQPRLGHSPYVVVAEAAGYQGCRFTGIAITCERMLLGHHPTITPAMIIDGGERTSRSDSPFIEKDTQRRYGFNEPTDTVVWNAIADNGIDPYDVLLWNIFPFHPHKAGQPLSNRTPTGAELKAGWQYTRRLLAMNGDCRVLAVGRKAALTLAEFGVAATALRHPANGGAGLYKAQFAEAVGRGADK